MTASPHDLNEIVWHFAGYIHIADELARSRELYDGSAHRGLHEDFSGKRVVEASIGGDLENFLTARQRTVATPDQPRGAINFAESEMDESSGTVDPIATAAGVPARVQLALAGGGGGGGGFAFPEFDMIRVPREFVPADVEITVTYSDWAAQRVIQSSQIRIINSNNGAYANTDDNLAAAARDLHETHVAPLGDYLKELFEEAKQKLEEELPEEFQLPEQLGQATLMEFFDDLHAERKADAEAEAAAKKAAADAAAEKAAADVAGEAATAAVLTDALAEAEAADTEDGEAPLTGLFINGDQQEDEAEHPAVVRPQRPQDVINTDEPITTIPIVGVRTEMGWNSAFNGAEIIDLNEAGTTLVVKGDYFETNAIIQLNVYRDYDQVEIAGFPTEDQSTTGANDARNVAEFVREAAFDVLPAGRFHAGLTWNVDVLDGDFVDIKLLEQYNLIYDNDVGVVTTGGVYTRVLGGGNYSTGSASIVDFGKYDVIIVLGDYHEGNIIYQKNYLLDDDDIKAASALDEDYDGDLTQSASWSKNTLLNDATIENIGAQDFETMGGGLRDLIDAIGRGEVVFDPEVGWELTGNGTGTLDILYVTGDYYDLNVIQQTNVVADLDTAIQLLPDLAVGDGTEIKNIISTGENATINAATIIDVGATFHTYLDGEHYEDSILIQAEIVLGDDDDVERQDTDALVTEVIAFIGSPEDDNVDPSTAPLQDPAQQGDILNIMA